MGCALVVLITLSLKFKRTNRDVNHTFVCWSEVYALMHLDLCVCVWWEGKPLKLSSSSLALWVLRGWENWPSLWWALLNRPLTSQFFPLKLLMQCCSSVSQCPVNRLCSESLILPIIWLLQGEKVPLERRNSHQPNSGALCLKHRNVFVPHLWVIYDVIQRMAAEARVLFSPYCELIIFAVAVNELPRKQLCVFGTMGTKSLSYSC